MNSEFVDLEEQLRSLAPANLQFNRDQLVYSVGARAGSLQAWKKCRVCLASATVASLLVVASMGVLMARSDVGKVDVAGKGESTGQAAVIGKTGNIPAQTQWPNQPSQLGFSSIHNVDPWSREELQRKGISVRSWKHALQSEEPPLKWIEITFDTSHVPAHQGILMTAWFVSNNGDSEIASRAQTNAVDGKAIVVLVAVNEGFRANSYVDIRIWQPAADGGSEATGYKLSMKRIIDLAR